VASEDGYTIQANGAGSKIDLSHLSTMAGSSYYMLSVNASTGGDIDLAGAITGNTSLTLADANSTFNVAGVTSLQDAGVKTTGATINFSKLEEPDPCQP